MRFSFLQHLQSLVERNSQHIHGFGKNFLSVESHFLRQYRDWRHSQHLQSLVDFKKISIAFLAPISRLATLATSPKLGRLQNMFNYISRANIVTSGTRNISQAWSTSKNFQSHFSRRHRDWRHSQHLQSLVDFKTEYFNRISRANNVISST